MLILVFCYGILASCGNKSIGIIQGNGEFPKDKITGFADPVKNDSWQDDFDVIDYLIQNDTLYLQLRYGGGCGRVRFKLNTLEESNKSAVLALQCKDEDHCRAYKFKFMAYSLKDFSNKKHLTIKLPKQDVILR